MGLFDDIFGGGGDPASAAPTVSAAPANPVQPNTPNPLSGFLGGLMGPQQNTGSPGLTSDVLTALGQSLMFSPSNNPMKGFDTALNKQTAVSNGDLQKQRMVSALRAAGKTDAEIQALLSGQQPAGAMGGLSGSSPGILGSLFDSPSDSSGTAQMSPEVRKNLHF